MSNRELPMMPWFPQDFASATSAWTFIERALYRALLDAAWILDRLPADPKRLARIAQLDQESFDAAWATVSLKFETVNGYLINPRLEEHRALSKSLRESRQKGARIANAVRWGNVAERSASAGPASAERSSPSPSPSPEEEAHRSSGEVKPSPLPQRLHKPSPEVKKMKVSDPEQIARNRRLAEEIYQRLAKEKGNGH